MNYGARVWGPTGLLELDENSFTVRVVYSTIITRVAGEGRTRYYSIPEVNPATHSAVCIPVAPYSTSGQDIYAIQFTPVVGAGGVVIYFGCPTTSSGPTGLSPQRLLVMRFR